MDMSCSHFSLRDFDVKIRDVIWCLNSHSDIQIRHLDTHGYSDRCCILSNYFLQPLSGCNDVVFFPFYIKLFLLLIIFFLLRMINLVRTISNEMKMKFIADCLNSLISAIIHNDTRSHA
jgi:hypothetical protein